MICIRLFPYTNVQCLVEVTLYLVLGNLIRVGKVNLNHLLFCIINDGNESSAENAVWKLKCGNECFLQTNLVNLTACKVSFKSDKQL